MQNSLNGHPTVSHNICLPWASKKLNKPATTHLITNNEQWLYCSFSQLMKSSITGTPNAIKAHVNHSTLASTLFLFSFLFFFFVERKCLSAIENILKKIIWVLPWMSTTRSFRIWGIPWLYLIDGLICQKFSKNWWQVRPSLQAEAASCNCPLRTLRRVEHNMHRRSA